MGIVKSCDNVETDGKVGMVWHGMGFHGMAWHGMIVVWFLFRNSYCTDSEHLRTASPDSSTPGTPGNHLGLPVHMTCDNGWYLHVENEWIMPNHMHCAMCFDPDGELVETCVRFWSRWWLGWRCHVWPFYIINPHEQANSSHLAILDWVNSFVILSFDPIIGYHWVP